jgi:hypothetical protein
MRLSLLRGPMLLLLWQTAPVSFQQDSAGRVQIALGYGAGQFEQRDLSCAGDVLSANAVPFTARGAQIDAWPATAVRITAVGGALTSGEQTVGFGGFQVALEGPGAGIGLGAAALPWSALDQDLGRIMPSLYLRAGSRDGGHFRIDLAPPTPTPGATGDLLRMGIGVNQGLRHGVRGFFGVSVSPLFDESHVGGIFGELEFPVTRQLDLGLAGSWRSSETYDDAAARALVRYHLGR